MRPGRGGHPHVVGRLRGGGRVPCLAGRRAFLSNDRYIVKPSGRSATSGRVAEDGPQGLEVLRRVEERADRDAEALDDPAPQFAGARFHRQDKAAAFQHVLFERLAIRIQDPVLGDAMCLVVVKGRSAVVGSAVLAPQCRRRSGGVCDRSAVKVPSAPSVPCPPSIAPH